MHREWLTTSTRIWPLEFSTFRFYNSIFILALFFSYSQINFTVYEIQTCWCCCNSVLYSFFLNWCCCGGFYRIPALSSRHNCNVYTETYGDHAICLQSLCASIARIFCGQQNAIIRSVLLLLLLLLRFLSISFFHFNFSQYRFTFILALSVCLFCFWILHHFTLPNFFSFQQPKITD